VTCSFQCTVDGSTVAIDTQDTPRIDVELGSGGLGLEGEVHVTLNGRPAYRGPATRISLDVN
jgi:hypothetical protein